MAIAEYLLGLDQRLVEIEAEGGQVWVEAKSDGSDCLLCFHFQVGGGLGVVSVMIPDASTRKVESLARLVKDYWQGGVVSHGTIAGRDPRFISKDFSSYYVSIEPSREAREAAPVTWMGSIVNNLSRVVTDPAIVLAEVVHSA